MATHVSPNPATPNPSLSLLGKKIAFSALVQYFGKGIQLVLGAITLKLISIFLSQGGSFGIYASVSEYALFFSAVANLGIFAHVVRKMADEPQNGEIFLNSLVLRAVTAGVLFVVGIGIILLTGQGGGHESWTFLFGSILFLLALFFELITSVCDGMLQANYLMEKATFALVVGRVVNFIGVVGVIVSFIGIEKLLRISKFAYSPNFYFPNAIVPLFAVTMLGSLVSAALSFYFVRQKITFRWKVDPKFMLDILKAGLPFGIISLFNSLYFRFLPDYFGHEFLNNAQFGAFNVSFRIAQVVSLFSTLLMFSALPGFKQFVDQKHWHKARQLYKKLWWIMAGSGVLLVAFGSLFGEKMIGLLTHKSYFLPEFWFMLPLMLFLAAISYGYDLVLITLFALEKDRLLLKIELLALAVSLAFFGAAYGVSDIRLKILLVIIGAIAGESTMVLLGGFKVRNFFRKEADLVRS